METIIFATLDDRADFVEQFSNKSLNRLGATCVEVPDEDKLVLTEGKLYWDAGCELSSVSDAS